MGYASADGRSPIQLLTGCQTELQGGFEIHFKRSTGGGRVPDASRPGWPKGYSNNVYVSMKDHNGA